MGIKKMHLNFIDPEAGWYAYETVDLQKAAREMKDLIMIQSEEDLEWATQMHQWLETL